MRQEIKFTSSSAWSTSPTSKLLSALGLLHFHPSCFFIHYIWFWVGWISRRVKDRAPYDANTLHIVTIHAENYVSTCATGYHVRLYMWPELRGNEPKSRPKRTVTPRRTDIRCNSCADKTHFHSPTRLQPILIGRRHASSFGSVIPCNADTRFRLSIKLISRQ